MSSPLRAGLRAGVAVLLLAAYGAPSFAQAQAQAQAKGQVQSGAPAASPVPSPSRLPDGRPNWTGFWTPVGGLLDRDLGPGAVASRPSGAQGAQMPRSPHSPLRSPYRERYEKVLDDASRGIVGFDPTALCLPPGMPRMMSATYGMEILQTAGQVTITGEWQAAQRRIWTDGSGHPPEDELLPTYAGHSIGKWDGDTLVVDTVGVRDDVYIDQSGLPVSDALRVSERLYLDAPSGLLIDEVTVLDPKVFEKPWTHVRRYRFRPDLRLQEYVCEENNRNVGEKGEPVFP